MRGGAADLFFNRMIDYLVACFRDWLYKVLVLRWRSYFDDDDNTYREGMNEGRICGWVQRFYFVWFCFNSNSEMKVSTATYTLSGWNQSMQHA